MTRRPTGRRWSACATRWRRAGPDGEGIWLDGTRRHGAPAAGDHRPLRARRPADARRRARPRGRLQRLHLQPPRAARRARAARPRVPLDLRHRGDPARLARVGRGRCSTGSPGMFAFALLETGSGRCVLVRDRLGIKPLYLAELPGGGLRAASTLPALLAAGDVDTSVDPVALHHYLSWHSVVPAPRTILSGVRKLPPATLLTVEPDGTRRAARVLEPAARARRADRCAGGVARRAAGRPARRRAAAHGLRRAGRRAAVGRAGLEPDRRAAGRAGPARAGDVLDRLPRRGRARGQRVRVLRPRRAASSAPTTTRSGSAPTSSSTALPQRDRGDERADGLARLRRVLAARAGRQPRAQGRAVRPGRRRGARRLQLVPAAARGAGERPRRLRGGVLRPRPRAAARADRRGRRTTTSRARSRRSGSSARAPPRRSTARCGSTRASCSSTTRSSASTT